LVLEVRAAVLTDALCLPRVLHVGRLERRSTSSLRYSLALPQSIIGPPHGLFADFGQQMIEVRLLGSIDLRGNDGREVTAVLAQPKRLALLVYLTAARPRGFQWRDKLVALFWPDFDGPRARPGRCSAGIRIPSRRSRR